MHLTGVIYAVEIAFAFGLAIFVHELGHFIAAKRAGIKVRRFSLGLGPKLVGFTRGETEYVISLIPFGGYVSMLGEGNEPGASGDPRSFKAKPHGVRAVVIVMGVVMNAILGFVLFVAAFTAGLPVETTVLGAIRPGSPSWQAGLRPGDRILGVNGLTELDWWAINQEVAAANPEQGVVLDVQKADAEKPVRVTVRPGVHPQVGVPVLEVKPWAAISIRNVVPGMPAEAAGMRSGDVVSSVNDRAISSLDELLYLIETSKGTPIVMEVTRDGEKVAVTVTPERMPRWSLGIRPPATAVVTQAPPDGALARAGLRKGDRIISADGKMLPDYLSFRDLMNESVGKTVEVIARRDEEVFRSQLKLSAPGGAGQEPSGEAANLLLPAVDAMLALPRVACWAGGLSLPATLTVRELSESGVFTGAGLQVGDEIVSVGGRRLRDCFEMFRALVVASAGKVLEVEVLRGRFIRAQVEVFRPAGWGEVYLGELTCPLVIGAVEAGSPAAAGGVRPGMIISGVLQVRKSSKNGTTSAPAGTRTWEDLRLVQESVGRANKAGGEEFMLALDLETPSGQRFRTPPMRPVADESRAIYQVGIELAYEPEMELRRYGFAKALMMGGRDSVLWAKRVVDTLRRVATGRIKGQAVTGPVGIVAISVKMARTGVTKLAYLFAIININLAILNLLPIPVLDGGLLLLLLIEKIKRRPLSERALEIVHIVSWVLILTLIIYVTKNDIVRHFF